MFQRTLAILLCAVLSEPPSIAADQLAGHLSA